MARFEKEPDPVQEIRAALKDPVAGDLRSSELRVRIRERCTTSLWFLWHNVISRRDYDSVIHRDMCNRWEARRKALFSIWLVPRMHLKSSIWTIAGSVQEWLINPNLRICIGNANKDLAAGMIQSMQKIFEENAILHWAFPEYAPKVTNTGKRAKWSKDGFSFTARTIWTPEQNLEVMSPDASKVSRHYDLILFDDAVNDQNVRSAQGRDGVKLWMKNCLQLRHDWNTSRVRDIGTIWHMDDAHCAILKEEDRQRAMGRPPKWLRYVRKMVEGLKPEKSMERGINEGDGELLWPEKYTRQEVIDLLRETGTYVFSCNYQNEAVTAETAILHSRKLSHCTAAEVPPNLLHFAAIDLKAGKDVLGDRNALMVAAMDSERRLFIRDIVVERMDPTTMVDHVVEVHKRYGLTRIAIETVLFQQAIYRMFDRECRRMGVVLPWKELNRQKTTKVQRILAIEPVLSRGEIVIVKGCRNVPDLIEEMDAFTIEGSMGAHDDLLDCLADLVKIARPPGDTEVSASDGLVKTPQGLYLGPLPEQMASDSDSFDARMAEV